MRWDFSFHTHRIALLEMGHVLAGGRCRKVRDRLRDPNGYLGARAELRAGALLQEAGAKLTHEPSRPASGPDWRADWPDGSVYIEVKLSHTSLAAQRRGSWFSMFKSEFYRALGEEIRGGDSVRATLRLSGTLLDSMGHRLEDDRLVNQRAQHAASVLSLMAQLLRPLGRLGGRFILGEGCEVTVRPRRDDGVGLFLDGFFVVSDQDAVSLRLKDDLERAAYQLKETSGRRVILVDASDDDALQRPAGAIRSLLATEEWAPRIAAVMIVYRRYPHTTVELVRGPASDSQDTLHLLESKLRRCEHGHLHAEALVVPPTCTLGDGE